MTGGIIAHPVPTIWIIANALRKSDLRVYRFLRDLPAA